MYSITALTPEDFRPQARRLVLAGIHPSNITWLEGQSLFQSPLPETEGQLTVPKTYASLARTVGCHASLKRWPLLYQALWRLHAGEKHLLENPADPLTSKLNRMAKQVGRDIHKTHAFVRFRKTEIDGQETYLAWHRPDHRILSLAAPFFMNRFRNQRWGIATPDESCSWDMQSLVWGDGVPASAVPQHDAVENLWRTYYRHIFNPARIKINMMKSEMPVRHWRTLPETQDIPAMLRQAPERVEQMMRNALCSSERSQKRAALVKRRLFGNETD